MLKGESPKHRHHHHQDFHNRHVGNGVEMNACMVIIHLFPLVLRYVHTLETMQFVTRLHSLEHSVYTQTVFEWPYQQDHENRIHIIESH